VIFDSGEISQCVNHLKEEMRRKNFDAAVILGAVNVYYFCGVAPHSTLVVSNSEESCLFVQINTQRAEKDSWIKNLLPSVGLVCSP
jgi:Xaa-Pro aminopeptidase